MTEEQLTEILQRLWVQATGGCGSATPQLMAEIREIEGQLAALQTEKGPGGK